MAAAAAGAVAALDPAKPYCHLNWSIKEKATKSVKDVTGEVKSKLSHESWLSLPYYLLLCYLHNDQQKKDIPEARKALEQAKKENSGQFYEPAACTWIIEANDFCLIETLNRKENDLEALLKRQNEFSDVQRATIMALRAFCLVRFGPNGYNEAEKLYGEVNRLTGRSNFLFLFLHALLLAKIRRYAEDPPKPTPEEIQLWKDAMAIKQKVDSKSSDYVEFLGRYAEAALDFDSKTAVDCAHDCMARIVYGPKFLSFLNPTILGFLFLMVASFLVAMYPSYIACLSILVTSFLSFLVPKFLSYITPTTFRPPSLKANYKALIKCHKVYRVCLSKKITKPIINAEKKIAELAEIKKQMSILTQYLFSIESAGIQDSQFYHTLALQRNYEARELKDSKKKKKLKQCKALLKKAQEHAADPGHIYVDLDLVDVRITLEEWDAQKVRLGYQSLSSRYSGNYVDAATVWINLGWYLITKADSPDDGMKLIADAIELFASVRLRNPKSNEIINCLHEEKKTGYLLWFKHKFRSETFVESAENYLNENFTPLTEVLFVRVNLAHAYLKDSNFERVVQLEINISSMPEKRYITLKRLLMTSDRDFGDINKELKALAEDNGIEKSSLRGYTICTELLKKLANLSSDPSWNPQTQVIYELCAQICLSISAHGADIAKAEIGNKINNILKITKDHSHDMRRHRFSATQFHLKQAKTVDDNTNLRVSLQSTIREARSSLDKSVKNVFPGTKACFPFAVQGKTESPNAFRSHSIENIITFETAFNSSLKKQIVVALQEYQKWKREAHDPTSYPHNYPHESAQLLRENFPLLNRLSSREYQILKDEGLWLLRWVQMRNSTVHESTIPSPIEVLNNQLNRDNAVDNSGPKDAYELAHRAAEFAEETRLVCQLSEGMPGS